MLQQEGVDWPKFRKLVTADERIGPSPSLYQERGFGGHCLSKDTQATELSVDGNMLIPTPSEYKSQNLNKIFLTYINSLHSTDPTFLYLYIIEGT